MCLCMKKKAEEGGKKEKRVEVMNTVPSVLAARSYEKGK